MNNSTLLEIEKLAVSCFFIDFCYNVCKYSPEKCNQMVGQGSYNIPYTI